MPNRALGENLFYSFDLGPLHVLVYNTGGWAAHEVPTFTYAPALVVGARNGVLGWGEPPHNDWLGPCRVRSDSAHCLGPFTSGNPGTSTAGTPLIALPELGRATSVSGHYCAAVERAASDSDPAEVLYWPDSFGVDSMRRMYEWMERDLQASSAAPAVHVFLGLPAGVPSAPCPL
jgi:hypothetical protein